MVGDAAYENAQKLAVKLSQEIEYHEKKLNSLMNEKAKADQFLSLWREFAGLPSVGPTHDILVARRESPAVSRAPRAQGNTRKEEVAAMAREVISEAGVPVSRGDLMAGLIARGAVIKGTDPFNVMGTMLHRMKQSVIRLESGYWLPELPYEPAGYRPPDHRSHADLDDLLGPIQIQGVKFEEPI